MSTTAIEQQQPAGGESAKLQALLDHVQAAEREIAKAVTLAGELAGSGISERVEGLPLDLLLGLQARMTGGDRGMLITAGEELEGMPATAQLFAAGRLSWGQVRGIVCAVKRLGRDDRAAIDARVAETATDHGGIDGLSPDDLVWSVSQAADECKARRSVERREQRRKRATFFALQGDLEGGLTWWGQTADPGTAATIVNALDAAAARPTSNDGDREPGEPTSRGHQYGQAFADICAAYLGGDTNRPARPLFVVHVDLADASAAGAGLVEVGVRGPLPSLTARTIEAMTSDADLRAVLFDGQRPLAVSAKLTASTIPAKTRIAVGARDRGDRFPGSRDPYGHCDLHHLHQRAHGGDHHPDNLVALSRRHHTLVHRHGWRMTLDADTGGGHHPPGPPPIPLPAARHPPLATP